MKKKPASSQSSNTINSVTNIPACMVIKDIQDAKLNDTYLQDLKTYVIEGWPTSRQTCKAGHMTMVDIQG